MVQGIADGLNQTGLLRQLSSGIKQPAMEFIEEGPWLESRTI
jgi:hypothetical protein